MTLALKALRDRWQTRHDAEQACGRDVHQRPEERTRAGVRALLSEQVVADLDALLGEHQVVLDLQAIFTNDVLDRAWHAMIKTTDGNNYVGVRRILAEALSSPSSPSCAPAATPAPVDDESLKPCPFCGGEARKVAVTEPSNVGGYVIACSGCEASTRVWFPVKDSVDQILREAWNQREASPRVSAATPAPVKVEVTREWCERAARNEADAGDPDITAGAAERPAPTWQPIKSAKADRVLVTHYGQIEIAQRRIDSASGFQGWFIDGHYAEPQPTRFLPLPVAEPAPPGPVAQESR